MDRLPPFDALIAFEAVVRLGGMTAAAAELGVTQSAVSHRIRRLEDHMGACLLQRRAAGVSATAAGAVIVGSLPGLLEQMGELRARCLAVARPERLTVGVDAALAQHWLIRRLPAFAEAQPDLGVELVVSEAGASSTEADIRVFWRPAAELRATSTQQPLFQERVFPVCHPSLLPPDFKLGDASVLSRLPLLHKGPPGPATSAEWSWPAWLERLGLLARPKETLRFASLGPAIAAALEGAGVVLARSILVHDALADGRLARILPPAWDLPSSKAHVARWPAALRTDERVQAFATWLSAEARRSVGDLR
jgi:LysR family glycine cleavage system transcriptional activator